MDEIHAIAFVPCPSPCIPAVCQRCAGSLDLQAGWLTHGGRACLAAWLHMGSRAGIFFSCTMGAWRHGGGAAPRLATDGLPPTPLPRPRHLCGVRGCDRPQVPGMRGRWRSRTALGRGGARGGVSSHLPRGSVEPRCSRMGGRTCCGEVRTRPPPATTGCTGCRHVRAAQNSLVPLGLRGFSATSAWCRDMQQQPRFRRWAAPWAGSWGVR